MASLLSEAKSKTQARKYRDRPGDPRWPKYYGKIEAVNPTSSIDLFLLAERVEKDPDLWFVQGNPGQANELGKWRRTLKPHERVAGSDDTDPAGLVTPPSPELLIFDIDSGRWPLGTGPDSEPETLARAAAAELFELLGRDPCSAVVAFSGNHVFKGFRAKIMVLPDRALTWGQAADLYARADSDQAMSKAGQPIFLAPPMLPDDSPDPLPDGRIFYVEAAVDKLDCSSRPGDGARNTWAALHRSLRALERLEDGSPRHDTVNRCAYQCAGIAAGEKAPGELVVDFLLGMLERLPQYSDRDFADEVRRAVEDGYKNPVKPFDAELQRSKDGEIKATLSNAAILLSHEVHLIENDFGDHELTRQPPWESNGTYPQKVEEHQLRRATAWLQSTHRTSFKKHDVSDAIAMLAGDNRVDRLVDYLKHCETLPPGKLTLENAHAIGWGATDTPAHALAIRRFLIQSVKRAFEPGCHAELVLVLHAPPGKGKGRSTWQLFTRPGLRYFTSSHISVGNQAQHAPILRGLWGAELGEQKSVTAWKQDVFKSFVSQRKIVMRLPYDRRATEIPLRVNYVWTTEHETPLVDDNWRRFLVLEVQQWREWSGEEIDRLWGDAVRAYRAGERAWLDADDEAILQPARELAYDVDALETHVEAILHTPELEGDLRAIDTVVKMLAMRQYFGVKVADSAVRHRVGKIMKRLGWTNRPTWLEGKTSRSYFPPDDWAYNNYDGEATDVTTTY